MGRRKNNYPEGQLDDLGNADPNFVSTTVYNLKQLYKMDKPESDAELEDRIQFYFDFCESTQMRPGIESLSLCLGVNRTTVFRWGNGIGCSERRMNAINKAKNVINSFLEQSLAQGKISPPSGIFLLKNWCGYKDENSIEITTEKLTESSQDPEEIAMDIASRHLTDNVIDMPEPPKIIAENKLSDN